MQELTPRERQVCGLIFDGRSNKEIAHRLHLSEGTVKIYGSKLFLKLGVHSRAELFSGRIRELEQALEDRAAVAAGSD